MVPNPDPKQYWNNWKNDMSLFSATSQERTYQHLLHNCYFITFWTVIISFFLSNFWIGWLWPRCILLNLQNPSRKPNRKIVVHKSFKYISNFKTCLTDLPVLITNICLFLDEVAFIDVGKHRQSLIDGLLRRISQVLANQKQREKSKWPIRVFRRNSGRNFGKERKERT